MATGTLTGSTIAATYKSILKVKGGANNVLDADPQLIEDGDGNDSVLGISTDSVLISGSGTRLDFNTDGSGEYISGDGTDLTIGAGSDIHLTATNDVNIPVNVGLRFGDGGENIETDNTDLTITSGADILFSPANYVGIGLTNPEGRLTIQGASSNTTTGAETSTALRLINSSGASFGYGSEIQFYQNNAQAVSQRLAGIRAKYTTYSSGTGGDLIFYTNVPPSTINEALVIKNNGDVTLTGDLIMADGKGINFAAMTSPADAAAMAAETLTDYEEGTWTVDFTGSSGSEGSSATTTTGAKYTKIGRTVYVEGYATWTDLGSWSGSLRIAGLPFTVTAGTTYPSVSLGEVNSIDFAGGDSVKARFQPATNYWYLVEINDDGAPAVLPVTSASTGTYVTFSGTYTV